MSDRVNEKNALQCRELAVRFANDGELWQRYRDVVKGLEGIDVDAEFVSRPVRNYINFVSNDVRDWLLQNCSDIEIDKRDFEYFHRLIEKAAKNSYRREVRG